ncbi:hypothetical protein P9112_014180 [Eukaryota sp. TZLM1-RC]
MQSKLASLVNSCASEQRNFTELRDFCEDEELETLCLTSLSTHVPFYAVLQTCYLCLGEYQNAQLLWKRVPDDLKSVQDSEITVLNTIVESIQDFDFNSIYHLVNHPWSPLVAELFPFVIKKLRSKIFGTIEILYTSLKMSTLQELVNLSLEEIQEVISKRGWTFDEEYVYPIKSVSQGDVTPEFLTNFQEIVSTLDGIL